MGVGQDRWVRISRALASGHPVARGLCSACAETLSVAGAGITLIAVDGAQVAMCASNPTVRGLAELEFTLGEGPASDTHQRGVPVLECDLVHAPPARWAAFAGSAVDAGIGAVYAFPLRLGAARLGALIAYQEHPGTLSEETSADALAAADVITRAIVSRQAGMPEEALLAELADDGAFRAQVHQAAGMVSVQLGISVGDALSRLRARAFAADRTIGDVAADVVSRRLRFDE
ncbi:MAG: hypothetical protein QOJ52_1160 [Acidimicrobiaceae bacterium]|jgi:hypothetical protein|nr:hypothetical protein [Acidimicrobiaceae bacterium]MDQ1379232.1 hypothetical protein [Acidimicrobiaceae bacterium]MDQ1398483.1 hypothetical protein [Acidimicrobiaceae bacterium]MDQ1413496.1 hypothetical protein [Acidimicrobiaceae bacterium]MDQ1417542.1 hypothetical protein [Acidimicrobiaceae bacterium]